MRLMTFKLFTESIDHSSKMDSLLDRISKDGIDSLSAEEKEFMDAYSKGDTDFLDEKDKQKNVKTFTDDNGYFRFDWYDFKDYGDEVEFIGEISAPLKDFEYTELEDDIFYGYIKVNKTDWENPVENKYLAGDMDGWYTFHFMTHDGEYMLEEAIAEGLEHDLIIFIENTAEDLINQYTINEELDTQTYINTAKELHKKGYYHRYDNIKEFLIKRITDYINNLKLEETTDRIVFIDNDIVQIIYSKKSEVLYLSRNIEKMLKDYDYHPRSDERLYDYRDIIAEIIHKIIYPMGYIIKMVD